MFRMSYFRGETTAITVAGNISTPYICFVNNIFLISQKGYCGIYTQKKKAGPHDQHVRVIGLHQKRPAYQSKLNCFSNRSNDPSG